MDWFVQAGRDSAPVSTSRPTIEVNDPWLTRSAAPPVEGVGAHASYGADAGGQPVARLRITPRACAAGGLLQHSRCGRCQTCLTS